MPFATGFVLDDLLLVPSQPLAAPHITTQRTAITVAPNPTHAGASVRLASGTRRDARVEVLDATGRLVARLLPDGDAGEWAWDGRDARGRPAAPGSYLVRVTYGARTQVSRLVKLQR